MALPIPASQGRLLCPGAGKMGLACEGQGLWMAVQGFGNFKSFLCKNALCPPGQRLGGGGREGGSPARPAKRWFVTMPLGEHICPCTCRWGKCKFRQLPSAEGTGVGLCRNYPQASWNATHNKHWGHTGSPDTRAGPGAGAGGGLGCFPVWFPLPVTPALRGPLWVPDPAPTSEV